MYYELLTAGPTASVIPVDTKLMTVTFVLST